MKGIKILWFVAVAFLIGGCEKFLDKKQNQKLVVPNSLFDIQAILDDYTIFNQSDPNAVFISADQYVLDDASFNSLNELIRNIYLWQPSTQFPSTASDNWGICYNQIYTANVALENLADRGDQDTEFGKDLQGRALFFRGKALYNALLIWTLPYRAEQAENRLGLPLRLEPNYNKTVVRASQQETFLQTIKDLRDASNLLPVVTIHPTRPSKAAAFGYLARMFLLMNEVDSCLKYTNQALALHSKLMDFNNDPAINPNATYTIARFNSEVIFDASAGQPVVLANGVVDPLLYASYGNDDLRKTLFHRGTGKINYFKGSYNGSFDLFTGIATGELLLNKAECLARKDQVQDAMATLNLLLAKRYKANTFSPLNATNRDNALTTILREREKELVFRGLRWLDLKRLNALGNNITLRRLNMGMEYVLQANSLRYAMPIPERTIRLTGIPQNPTD